MVYLWSGHEHSVVLSVKQRQKGFERGLKKGFERGAIQSVRRACSLAGGRDSKTGAVAELVILPGGRDSKTGAELASLVDKLGHLNEGL